MPLGDKNTLSTMCKESKSYCKCIFSTSETFINYVFSFLKVLYCFYGEVFHFSQDLRESIYRDNLWLLNFSSYNTSGPLAPSSHEMRYKPLLGSISPKAKNVRKQKGRSVESGKYG